MRDGVYHRAGIRFVFHAATRHCDGLAAPIRGLQLSDGKGQKCPEHNCVCHAQNCAVFGPSSRCNMVFANYLQIHGSIESARHALCVTKVNDEVT